MRVYKRAILPLDFKANAVASGIKKANKLDLALFYSERPVKAACQFTTNKIQAAPIKINKRYLKKNNYFQAIIVNSGNANCFTGKRGLSDAEETSQVVGEALGIKKEGILISSTGIIGRRLPLQKIKQGIPKLVKGLSCRGIDKAKIAILTTDTFAKEITVRFNMGSRLITICGIAKGAGMIAPNMATMLCFIFTDANIAQAALDKSLKIAIERSFNCISVDGCMSTNDTVIILANGRAGNDLIDINKNFNLFMRAIDFICLELAKSIIKDAEGASKFIQIKVNKAKTVQEAKQIGLSIANYNLFKIAMYGQNPNFGRIVAAIGGSGIDLKEKDVRINVGPLNKKDIFIDVSVNRGNKSAIVYTSDLTPEYIKINAEYN